MFHNFLNLFYTKDFLYPFCPIFPKKMQTFVIRTYAYYINGLDVWGVVFHKKYKKNPGTMKNKDININNARAAISESFF